MDYQSNLLLYDGNQFPERAIGLKGKSIEFCSTISYPKYRSALVQFAWD